MSPDLLSVAGRFLAAVFHIIVLFLWSLYLHNRDSSGSSERLNSAMFATIVMLISWMLVWIFTRPRMY